MPNPTIGAAIAVNSSTAGGQYQPVVAATANGMFVVGWYDAPLDDYLLQTFSTTGARIYSERKLFANGSAIDGLELAGMSDGSLVTAFIDQGQNDGDVRFYKSTPTDLGYAAVTIIGDNVSVSAAVEAGLEANIFIAETSPSEFSIGYTEGAIGQSILAGYDDSQFFRAAGGNINATELDGVGDFVIGRITSTNQVVFGYRSVLGSSFVVAEQASAPKLALLADGAYVAAFQVVGGVGFRIFYGDNTPPRTGVLTASLDSTTPDIVALDDGRFMIVWAKTVYEGIDPVQDRIVGHIYKADGTSDSTEFLIDSTARNPGQGPALILPRVDQMADGRVVVTYQSGLEANIVARILDPRTQGVEVDGTPYADQYVGSNFADILSGGDGNDDLAGGAGIDILVGGRGNDTASYQSSSAGVTVNLLTKAASGGDAAGDTLVSIENVQGSQFADVLTGDNGNNVLEGLDGEDTIRGGGGNDTILGGEGGGTFYGDGGEDAVLGGDGIDKLYGGADDDTLNAGFESGQGGTDILDGGTGADGMISSFGRCHFFVDNIGDTIADGFDADGDRVFTSISYTLTDFAQIEIFSTTNTAGTGAINLTGNEFAQQIIGNAGANVIDGRAGADTMTGFAGDDTYYVDNKDDKVVEGANGGFDKVYTTLDYTLAAGVQVELLATTDPAGVASIFLTGNEFAQTLQGNNTENTLNGKGGADTMQGFGGNDRYLVDNAGDVVIEVAGGGTGDFIQSSVSYVLAAAAEVESLGTDSSDGTAAINLTGNQFAQSLLGNAGANILDGRGGADIMNGVDGNDQYYVDNLGDDVNEGPGGGNDRVLTSISYALDGGAEIELFTTTNTAGAGAINLTGNELAQTIVGNAGVNLIDGQGGADTMQGMGGSDTYLVDNAGDRIVEAAGGGSDSVKASISYVLTVGAEVEVLRTGDAAGVAAINLTGNASGQTIIGNAGANILNGLGAADTMQGLGGNDQYYVDNAADAVVEGTGQGAADRVLASISYTLAAAAQIELLTTTNAAGTGAINLTGNALAQTVGGNAGVNILNGGAGSDTISGFGGADFFLFNTALGAGNVDRLPDFSAADTIRLENAIFAGLAAGALASGAFNTGSAATQADDRIIYNATTGVLLYDADGLNGNAGIQFATLNTGLTLTSADFAVV